MDITPLLGAGGAGVFAGGIVELAKRAVGFNDRYSGLATLALATAFAAAAAATGHLGSFDPFTGAVVGAWSGLAFEGLTNIIDPVPTPKPAP